VIYPATTTVERGVVTATAATARNHTQQAGAPTTVTLANAAGSVTTGGNERGLTARTGRISWRELVRH
jgi:hypothetical protein